MRNCSTNQLTLAVSIAFALTIAACQPEMAHGKAPQQHDENALTIETESDLPETSPGIRYEIHLQAHGGVPRYHWHVEQGALPFGIQLDDRGILSGKSFNGGEYQFTTVVRDESGQHVRKQFVIRVRTALVLTWKDPARVNGNRIEGSAEVSNHTGDDIDLTFVVMAVAGNGRATAIGYQHFVLSKGTTDKELPFGDTLPHGGYVVHVDAIGEVAPKKLIYRERMQTPGPLHVEVGP